MSDAQPVGRRDRIQVAQYVRMSTEHQRYSIDNQRDVIARYAAEHGYEIVQTYADPGRSGLRLAHRPALQRLIADIKRGAAYAKVLVLDVSRWGRFQDNDESAFYEFTCKRHGVAIEYCAETFQSGGGIMDDVVRAIKRAMAGEFSRELSVKVTRAQRRLAAMGYSQGGVAPYGIQRLLKSDAGGVDEVLAFGARKHLAGDRVVLRQGPVAEQRIVRFAFVLFCRYRLSPALIARLVNAATNVQRRPVGWNEDRVMRLLTNDIYVGDYVYHKRTRRLGSACAPTPTATWVTKSEIFAPIVPRALFSRAAKLLRDYSGLTRSEKITFFRHDLVFAPAPLKQALTAILRYNRADDTAIASALAVHAVNDQNLYKVYRSERKSLGWMSRAKFQELRRAKFFADRFYGSKEAARDAAAAWGSRDRDLLLEYRQLRRRLTVMKNNKSGIAGVCKASDRGRRYTYWVASWTDEHGRALQRSFSVAKFGEQESFDLAVATRAEAVKQDVARLPVLTAYLRARMLEP